jgi:hypothetical protein
MGRVLPDRRRPAIDCIWSKTGAVIIEIETTLLTVMVLGECRVSREHFGQRYVWNRCSAKVGSVPKRAPAS